jgi:putative endonuclease
MPYYVYILSNKAGTVLYTGVTNNLAKRVLEHKAKLAGGFTKKYNVDRLVYYDVGEDVMSAIEREKAIKGGSRRQKLQLIESLNATWRDLFYDL